MRRCAGVGEGPCARHRNTVPHRGAPRRRSRDPGGGDRRSGVRKPLLGNHLALPRRPPVPCAAMLVQGFSPCAVQQTGARTCHAVRARRHVRLLRSQAGHYSDIGGEAKGGANGKRRCRAGRARLVWRSAMLLLRPTCDRRRWRPALYGRQRNAFANVYCMVASARCMMLPAMWPVGLGQGGHP